MKYLTFMIEKATGFVYSVMCASGYSHEFACPVMDFEGIGKDGDYTKPIKYDLQKFPLNESGIRWWQDFIHTKKIPIDLKNKHRIFWGMKPVKESKWSGKDPDPKIVKRMEAA